jgi:hypothetical protein
MTDAAAWAPIRVGAAPATAGTAASRSGERIAVGLTAAAVALLPLLRPGGPANIAPVDLLIALSVSACLLWAGSSGRRLRFPYAASMLLFMLGGALGALVGPVPRSGLVALTQDGVLLLWCWVVVNVGSSPERLRTLMSAWAYAALAWVLVLFTGLVLGIPALSGQTDAEGSRTALTLLDPNFAASYWFVSIMVVWAAGVPRRRGLRVLAYVLLVAAIVSTGSNSGVLSLLVGAAVAAVLACHARFGLAAACHVVAVLALGGYMVAGAVSLTALQQSAKGSPYAFVRDGVGRGQSSASQRGALMGEGVRLYREGGPLGQGPVSTKTRLRADMAPYAKEAHDDYLAALLERGFVGLVALMLLVAGLGMRIVRLAAGRSSIVPRPYALVGAVAGTLVAMAVNELLHVRHVWTLFAFVAALSVWSER